DFIHGCKITHALEEDIGFDDGLKRAACGFQHLAQVFKHALGLLLNASTHDLAGGRVQRNLPSSKDKVASFDGLAIGTNGGWSMRGSDLLTLHSAALTFFYTYA